jgi:predicted TIM-barrel fold metal-dependent hydrolase
MAGLPYAAVDADNHYYEPRDCFTRHIEARFRERSVRAATDASGRDIVVVDGRPYLFFDPKWDRTNPPGSLKQILRDQGNAHWRDSYSAERMHPAYQGREARLALLDEQGLQAAIMLPTLGVCVEHPLRHDVELTYASLRAFNRWIEEDWGYAYQERIFAPPLLSLLDLQQAVAELERVLRAGARLVHLRPGPVARRSPADPQFDPFWARLQESGVPVVFHISDSGYNELFAVQWGEQPDPPVREQSAFQWAFFHGDRPIMETLGALVFHNLFGRFPRLRVLSIENGAGWVKYLLRNLDKKKAMGRFGPWPGGRFRGRPSEILREHCFVAPYPEDDLPEVVEVLGAERVLFGSDFPHPEGLAEPLEFAQLLGFASAEQQRRILRSNTAELLGLAP